jgi:hypothetical protein
MYCTLMCAQPLVWKGLREGSNLRTFRIREMLVGRDSGTHVIRSTNASTGISFGDVERKKGFTACISMPGQMIVHEQVSNASYLETTRLQKKSRLSLCVRCLQQAHSAMACPQTCPWLRQGSVCVCMSA